MEQVQQGARALTCRGDERADASNTPTSWCQGLMVTCSLCTIGACGGNQRPCQTTDKASVQSTDTPPPPAQGARQPGWGERRGPREHPGERVGARGRGRGRARRWHTRETARHRQGGQTCRQGRQREGEWEGRQVREGAQGSGTGVARRRAGGTRRAGGSSRGREHEKKKTAGRADTQEGHKEEAGRGRRGPTRVQ